jgi:hypothetical protein
MALTAQQISGLDAASARKLAGTANATDIANLNYAAKNGYVYKAPTAPQGSVAINGAQYNTGELQKQNFDNIQPVNGTLYGVPKATVPTIPSAITASDLNGNAKTTLDNLVAQNAQTQAQSQIDTINKSSDDMLNSFTEFQKQYQALATPSADEKALQTNISDKQTQLTNLDTSFNQGFNAIEDKVVPMDFIAGQQASLERRYNQQRGTLSAEEANLINRLKISTQDRKDIQAGLLSTYQVQQKVQEAVANNAKEVYAVARQLTADQQEMASNILTSLSGVDPSKLTGDMRSQLTVLFTQANIPQALGFAMLQQAYDTKTIETAQKNDAQMLSAGFNYVSAPAERDKLKAQGYEITQMGGRTYAKKPEAVASSWTVQDDSDGNKILVDSKTGAIKKITSVTGNATSSLGDLTVTGANGSDKWSYGLDVVLQTPEVKYPFNDTGEVIFAGENGGFGNQVKVRTSAGDEIWFSHLNNINSKVGDKVTAGSFVGVMGNTGTVYSTNGGDGTHLDVTMKNKDGKYYTAPEVSSILGVTKKGSDVIPKDKQAVIAQLSDDVRADLDIKEFISVRDGYERMKTGSEMKNAVGDMALIFGYMKMLDPTSTVREGEYANAENTRGIPATIMQQYNKALAGDKLSEGQRGEFKNAAEKLYSVKKVNYDKAHDFYSEKARKLGVDPNMIIRDYSAAKDNTETTGTLKSGITYTIIK